MLGWRLHLQLGSFELCSKLLAGDVVHLISEISMATMEMIAAMKLVSVIMVEYFIFNLQGQGTVQHQH